MKLELAKGTRDFSPEEKIARDKIMVVLREVCELYGFNPMETPIIERYETLSAKFAAGDESDAMKETFKLEDQGGRKLGLRFDLTVPFSRYMAMNKGMKKPFKKYMYGEVFRDGPIKTGRYRQFTQFDPDVVGCKSMVADAEVLALAETAFTKLGFKFFIELNNKKVLDGLMEDAGISKEECFNVLVSVDKLKKIGEDGVKKELEEKGYDEKVITKILSSFVKGKDNRETLEKLKKIMKSEEGKEGLKEVEDLFNFMECFGVSNVVFEPSLARGLNYYTGTIFEVFLKDSKIKSSVAGGGRFDELIGNYMGGSEEFPAVGFAFGVDVIIEAMREKSKFERKSVVDLFVIPIKCFEEGLKLVTEFRKEGVRADIDLLDRNMSKIMKYVDSYSIPFVVFVGEEELKKKKVKLKEMSTGKEELLSVGEVVKKIL